MSFLNLKVTHAEYPKAGTSKAGKPYSLRLQKALCTFANGETRSVEFTLGDAPALEVGKLYKLDGAAILTCDRFGSFEVDSRAVRAAIQ